ncbi:MAG: hypothetical protein FVQ77_04680 [Cytophagales bacterium]|nr:hypothetical protein [Cytophagales bacterium]
MDKDTIERKLKAELVLFQMYVILLMGVVTGDINLLLNYINDYYELILNLLIFGVIIFVFILTLAFHSFFKIKKLTKNN